MASSQSPKGAAGSGSSQSTTASGEGADHLLPGSLVFAKMKSFPPWPAKVISIDEFPGSVPKHHVPVHFLGSGDYGHVAAKECFPYAEYREQYGTPKQRPKLIEAIREAEEIFNSEQKPKQPQSRKRAAPKSREQEKPAATAPPSAKKPRGGKAAKAKADTGSESAAAAQPSSSRHDDEELMTADKFLPASQLAEIAASTVFEPDSHTVIPIGDDTRKQPSPTRGPTDEDDDEDVDDAIFNVVRQLEELEKQEADEQRRSQTAAAAASAEGGLQDDTPATEPKRRGRGGKKTQSTDTPESSLVREADTYKTAASKAAHKRSMSETTDDGRGASITLGRQSSGSETPLSGGEGGLGKRRHKPKVMSDYFLEKDYSAPRSHKKSESSGTPASTTPATASQPTKSQQQKSTKTPAATAPKATAVRGRKAGSGASGKMTKDLEKAALESDIERVRMAASENPNEQQQATGEQQFWPRHDTFSDLPFDDSMFEVTVDVEEAPSGAGGHASAGGETSTSRAAAKRRRDAQEAANEKERLKQKEKLKVKILKGPLPAPKGELSIVEKRGKKKGSLASAAFAKKAAMGPGKMKVKIAKKRATKAAKLVAAAELKNRKKPGRKPMLDKKPKHEKRISGYSIYADREMPGLRQERPDLKGVRQLSEILKARYQQLPESERQAYEIMAQREKAKRKATAGDASTSKKGKGLPQKPPTPAAASPAMQGDGRSFYGRIAGTSTSPKGYSPASPRGTRMYVMSPQHAGSSGVEIQQQPEMAYDQSGVMLSGQDVVYHQMGAAALPETYGNVDDPNAQSAYMANYGMQGQQQYSQPATVKATPSPAKRPRGRPPKTPRSEPPQPKLVPRPQMRPAGSSQPQEPAPYRPSLAPLPKSMKIPKRESAAAAKNAGQQQQQKGALRILTAGQHRPAFQARSPRPLGHQQNQAMLGLEEPPVPEAMSHEELVYDSETAAMAAAAAAAMDMGGAGMVPEDGMVEQMAYGHVGHQGAQHGELGTETETAVSFLTGSQQASDMGMGSTKSKSQLEDDKAAKKRESRRRSRAKQRAIKEQKKIAGTPGQQQTPGTPGRGQKRDVMAASQYGTEEAAFGDQSVVTAPPAAYEDAYVEPRPSEEETNMFFFGTTQDVQALLELRNPPGTMEGQCRWWLAEEPDPDLLGGKRGARGTSPPRALTAEPLDAAAVFKLIGRTFENVGNQLMREEGEDSAHEIAAGIDMLLDGLVSSVSHLLTLTGAIPPFDRRYRRDVASRLVEETSMMIPL